MPIFCFTKKNSSTLFGMVNNKSTLTIKDKLKFYSIVYIP